MRLKFWSIQHEKCRRGFTLLESLMATGILLAVVVSVSSAITAGQQSAYEAQQRIAATLAAEELMGRLITLPYDQLAGWHGHTEAVGAMTDCDGNALPGGMAMVGRNVRVTTALQSLGGGALDVRVQGRLVQVVSFNAEGRELTELRRFIPEPQS